MTDTELRAQSFEIARKVLDQIAFVEGHDWCAPIAACASMHDQVERAQRGVKKCAAHVSCERDSFLETKRSRTVNKRGAGAQV